MSDNYTKVGYASGDIGGGLRPAVLVVDFQTAFTAPKYPLGGLPMVHAARDRTADLLQVARARRLPVAACYTAYCSPADMPLWKVKAVREEFFYGHPCTGMDPKIHHPDHFTYCKNAPSETVGLAAGDNNFVTIDMGSESGLTPGNILTVFRTVYPKQPSPRKVVGELAVLTVRERTATAKIVSSRDAIVPGDQVELR